MHGPSDRMEQLAQERRISEHLAQIKYPIMVMSGKGGVGKSTVAVNLAYSLALKGHSVGIMDVDVHGPNVPKMLGIENRSFGADGETIIPIDVLPNLKVASIALAGYSPDEALIWRGPVKIALIRQFLADVDWGKLDYLIFDTPPGTGDESLTLAQTVVNMAGAVVVTTPQDVSILDSRKSITFANKLKVPILGIVENMSGFICPHCGEFTAIFKKDGGKDTASVLGLNFLGSIPIEPGIVQSGDAGLPFVARFPESKTSASFAEIVTKTLEKITENEKAGVYKKPDPPPKTDFRPER